jgi:hypothetical protein
MRKPKTPKTTTAKKSPAKKPAKKNQAIPNQPELFDSVGMANPAPTVEIHLRMPTGTSLTIGQGQGQGGANTPGQATPNNPVGAAKLLSALNREQLREALLGAKLSAAEVINLATVIHGILYPLAAIGAKVTRGRRY